MPDRVERDDHHRVGQDRRAEPRGIDADQQHVDPLVEHRSGFGGGLLRVEHLCERAAKGGAVAIRHHVRDGHEHDDQREPDDPEAPGRPDPAGVEERLPHGQQAPRQQQQVDGQQRPQDRRCDREGGESGEGLRGEQRDGDQDEDQRRHQEQHRQAGSPVERLAETREHRREAGRGEAAAVGVSGIGPDSAGVHDGRWSSSGEVVGPRRSLPGSGRGDAGRSISLPVTTRRLVL